MALRYPANDSKATSTTLFSTQVPAFWNTAALTQQLKSKGVQVNAQNPNPGTSLLAELLLGFGPTLLLVGLFVLSRASRPGRRRGARRPSGTSVARRRGG